MKHNEFTWQTTDGLQLYGQGWQPDADPVAVVCLVHGLGEHSGRYAHVATALNKAGYALLGFDLRGHGKSQGQRGHTSSYAALLDDIAHLLEEAEARYPGLPHFLYGHSLGGSLVLNYALRRCSGQALRRSILTGGEPVEPHSPSALRQAQGPGGEPVEPHSPSALRQAQGPGGEPVEPHSPSALRQAQGPGGEPVEPRSPLALRQAQGPGGDPVEPPIAGVIATGPALRTTSPPPAWQLALGKLMYRLWPTLPMPNGLDVNGLSHDPQVVRAYTSDPLVHDRISARLGLDLLQSGEWALAHAAEFPLPLLLMHGSADRITSPRASQEFAAKVPGDCTLKLWDGLYHEIHNEPQKQEVLDFMIGWLRAHIAED